MIPVQPSRRPRILPELPVLHPQVAAEEHQVAGPRHHFLAQQHPRRRPSRGIRGGEHHGVRVGLLSLPPSLDQPGLEYGQRLGRQAIGEDFDRL